MRYSAALFATALLAILGCKSSAPVEYKGTYQLCTPCHNGRTAPDLRGMFSTSDDLVRAAKQVQNPLMANIKGNDALLRGAARDLGLK
jgi:hypothetical protein